MIGKATGFFKNLFSTHDRRETVADFHTTIIRVDDNYISSSSIKLDEMLVGNIYSLKEVAVEDGAEISGNIMSRTAVVSGRVYGDVVSLEYAEIKNTAVINGTIRAKAISVQPGAIINGSIRIESDIDDRDLIRKVESRIPSNALKEPVFTTYVIPEVQESKLNVAIESAEPEAKLPASTKRQVTLPSAKPKPAETKPAQVEMEHAAPNSWY